MHIARSKASLIAAAIAVGLVATACSSDRDNGDDGGGGGGGGNDTSSDRFIFGTSQNPGSLDPSLESDGETFRVSRQVLETLIDHEPGTLNLTGGLAETWEQNDEGTEWTFNLRSGVKFHDDDDLTAEVVCANFDRWYNWSGTLQSNALSYYWQAKFGGFAENEDPEMEESNYLGCEATDELTAVINIAEPSANFPGAFSLAAFSIHSPTSLEAYAGDDASGEGANLNRPAYSSDPSKIAGTGPFKYESWDQGSSEVTISRFDDYWGETAGVSEVVFRAIGDEGTRRQALISGEIHGYDLVAPGDIAQLEAEDINVPVRDVYNLFYLAFTQESHEALGELEVRQAIAHALNRQELVDTQLPEGGVIATQFVPETDSGYSDDVPQYEYNVDRAKELLEEAGYADLELDFCYPTQTSRPYMPSSDSLFEVLKADLQAAGITITDKPMQWSPDYLDSTRNGDCPLYVLGWTGDFNESYNFLGTWFDGYSTEWGFRNDDIFDGLDVASKEPDPEVRIGLYQELNKTIMEYLPGVPISSSPPSIAFAENVNPPLVSALTQENFAEVSFK